jgi:hypothetical protein
VIEQVTEQDLRAIQELAGPVYQARSKDDFLLFAKGLVIPSATGQQLFFECMADFQQETFSELAPAIHALRDGLMPPCRRFWIERTKKSSKDMDLAVIVVWLMAFPTKPIKVQVVAANSKQAAIVADRAIELVHYNPWLNDYIEIVQGVIRNRDGRRAVWCRIEATGSAGESQGQTPDLLILNELVHVDRWEVMEAHRNNADGVPQGVVIVSTNAGIKGTKAWLWRQNALANMRTLEKPYARWFVHILKGRAPWISEEDVEEARQRDPVGSEFKRLWQGIWVSGVGDAVTEEEIDRAFCLSGPTNKRENGWVYVAGLDLGVSHDHAGMVVLGVNKQKRKIKVVRLKGWAPTLEQAGKLEVPIAEVRKECLRAYKDFNVVWFGYDPAAGGSFAAQDLRKHWINMQQVSFAGAANPTKMATNFVQAMKEGILQCYDDLEGRLRRDFGKFSIKVLVPTGYRLEAISDEYGHADVGTALVLALPKAVELVGGFSWVREDEDLNVDGTFDLDEEDAEAMPDVLKDIYMGG